jgi:hypothetical protein
VVLVSDMDRPLHGNMQSCSTAVLRSCSPIKLVCLSSNSFLGAPGGLIVFTDQFIGE